MHTLNEEEIRRNFKNELQRQEDLSLQSLKKIENKLKEHQDKLVFNANEFIALYQLDSSGLGNKYRKTLEKILLPIFQYYMDYKAEDLGKAIHHLGKNNILTSSCIHYANIIRIYGNLDSHYRSDEITRNEILSLTYRLIFILDEIEEKKLLYVDIDKVDQLQMSLQETNLNSYTIKTKKYYDKETSKWIKQQV